MTLSGDDFQYRLNEEANNMLVAVGSPESTPLYRSSVALMTLKMEDGTWCTLARDYNEPANGPSGVQLNIEQIMNPICL